MQAYQRRLVCPSVYKLSEVVAEFIFTRKSVFSMSYVCQYGYIKTMMKNTVSYSISHIPNNNYETTFKTLATF